LNPCPFLTVLVTTQNRPTAVSRRSRKAAGMRPFAVGWRPSKALIDRALQCAIESRLDGRRSQAESKSVSADLNSAVGVALIVAADPNSNCRLGTGC
jgi:hypothetical protein